MFELFSPNMLKTYEHCPKKYEFKYIKSLSMPVNDDIYVMGKNIHALASYYLRSENIDKMEQSLNQSEKLIWEYLKNIKYFKYKTVNTEYNLSVKIGECFFGGRLDALVEDEGTYYILDYKTGTTPKNAKFDYQTMIYMLAVREYYKTDSVVFVYIDLKNKSELKIELSGDLVLEYEKRLTDISKQVIKETFLAAKIKCRQCEYGKICYDKLLN